MAPMDSQNIYCTNVTNFPVIIKVGFEFEDLELFNN